MLSISLYQSASLSDWPAYTPFVTVAAHVNMSPQDVAAIPNSTPGMVLA